MPISKAEYKKLSLTLAREYEQLLKTQNAYMIAKQIRQYESISRNFDALIKALIEKGVGLSKNQLVRLDEYLRFVAELDKQINVYSQFNSILTITGKKDFATLAMNNSERLLSIMSVNFSRLPIESINKIIALSADKTPLHEVFSNRFNDRKDEAIQILVDGIAKGNNGISIARDMRKQLDITKYDSQRIGRTEVSNTYNQVSIDSYKASGIVGEYNFVAEGDACDLCLDVEANSPYPLDDSDHTPTQHPFCRCCVSPSLG